MELEVEPEVEPGVELGVCPGSVDSVDFAPPLLNVHSPVQSILPKCTLPCNQVSSLATSEVRKLFDSSKERFCQ